MKEHCIRQKSSGYRKAAAEVPASFQGLIHYDAQQVIGSIDKNCDQGIYGTLNSASKATFTEEDGSCIQAGTGNRTGDQFCAV